MENEYLLRRIEELKQQQSTRSNASGENMSASHSAPNRPDTSPYTFNAPMAITTIDNQMSSTSAFQYPLSVTANDPLNSALLPTASASAYSENLSIPPSSTTGINEPKAKKAKKLKLLDQHVCVTCGRTDSPEWRKGPQGPKTLCNACGLRWAKVNGTGSKGKEGEGD